MSFAVVKGAGYILVHAPDMVIHNGTTQTSERIINPDSEYLKELPKHLRNFDEVVSYAPNQTYIGNISPDDLSKYEMPWYDKKVEGADRFGKFGEIMPQDEFIGLMKISDTFDLVKLEKEFTNIVKEKLEKHPLMSDNLISKLKEGEEISEIEKLINQQHAEPIYNEGKLVGCVKRAHDIDINLNAHTLFENLVVKASGALALLNLLAKNNFKAEDIDYVIECSEVACGDMTQRGGGNFAKADF